MQLFSFLPLACLALAAAQSVFEPERPPSLPLAVSSPYLNIWLAANSPQGNGPYIPGTWPTFWAGATIGWAGLIRVDGRTYTWLGHPLVQVGDDPTLPTVADQTSATYSATRTIFELNVDGKVNLTVTFFSHHDGNDLQRQSLPFSYLNVDVVSADGKTHDVELYSDVSAEITSGDRNNTAEWKYGTFSGGKGIGSRKMKRDDSFSNITPLSTPTTNGKKDDDNDSPLDAKQLIDEANSLFNSVDQTANEIFKTFGALKVDYSGWRDTVQHPQKTLPLPAKESPLHFTAGGLLPLDDSDSGDHKSGKGKSKPKTNTHKGTNTNATGGIAYHKIYRQQQQAFSEVNDQAEWGYWYWVTDDTKDLTHQSGADSDVRTEFVNHGALSQGADTQYRAISDRWPVFGFSKDLGKVGSSPKSTLFGLGLAQEESIQYEGKGPYAPLKSLYTQYWGTELDAIDWFFHDYATATKKAVTLDKKIQDDSVAAHGQNLATLTTLVYRQVYAAYQLAGSKSQPYAFQKEISSNGNVNTADVIFPAAPLFLYQAPNWIRLTLDPLIENQEAGKWPYQFALHDIGAHFPNATGHPDGNAEQMPVEESGNSIILALAYAQKTNDNQFLKAHYDLFRQWNGYLIADSLLPGQQLSTDDFASAISNQTNLALKGIIGIGALAEIAKLTGHTKDAANFRSIAEKYIKKWEKLGVNSGAKPPHATLDYNDPDSHGLLYNLYADKLLNLKLVPQRVYDIQSEFYPTVINDYGVPLDTRATYTKSDWESWAAAVASPKTADLIYEAIAKWVKETVTVRPFTDLYDTISGDFPPNGPTFVARPVQGGLYAALALKS